MTAGTDIDAPAPTFGERVLAFNAALRFEAPLPGGVEVMNPFPGSACAQAASTAFYRKFYADHLERPCVRARAIERFCL